MVQATAHCCRAFGGTPCGMRSRWGAGASRPAGATVAAAPSPRIAGGTAGCEGPPSPPFPFCFRVPVIRGPWCSCVCWMPLASLHCRASSCLPASSQARPAWPGAPMGSQPGGAWLQVAVRLSRACRCRPAGQQQPSVSDVGWWGCGQCWRGSTPVHQKDGWVWWRRGCGVCPGQAVWMPPGLQGEAGRLWDLPYIKFLLKENLPKSGHSPPAF